MPRRQPAARQAPPGSGEPSDTPTSGGDPARCFIAIWPAAAERRALALALTGARWPSTAAQVPPANWHLTLHFIGPVPAASLPGLPSALRVPVEPFSLEFGATAVWTGGLVVLLPLGPTPALLALHEALARRLLGAGLPVEQRPFKPHVTLARRAVGYSPPGTPLRSSWLVREVALVQSLRGYRTLATWH